MVNRLLYSVFQIIVFTLLQGSLGSYVMSATSEELLQVSDSDKFELKASEGAPKLYPMEIISGHFFNPAGGSLYVPNKATLHHGWGRGWSNHLVGDDVKALPNRLTLSFFSYTEDKFYSGEFKLPYSKILALFKAGYYSPRFKEHVTYRQLTVGIAPGGYVSVWAEGINKTTEVFSGYAKEEKGEWKSIVNNESISRAEFIQIELEDSMTENELINLKNEGVPLGLWETYNKRYDWQLQLNGMAFEDDLLEEVKFYNGEKDYINYRIRKEDTVETRAIPSDFSFVWAREEQEGLLVEVEMNEKEIFSAFKQLAEINMPLKLEFRMKRKDNGKNDFTIWLHNEKDTVELTKFTLETYALP